MAAKDYNKEERYAIAVLGRRILIERVNIQQRLNALAESFGVSSMTIRRWVKRLEENGPEGLRRSGRSDCGVPRSTCAWAIWKARSMANSRTRKFSFRQIERILHDKARDAGPGFCAACPFVWACRKAGSGIKVGSRHAIARIVHCANLPIRRNPNAR